MKKAALEFIRSCIEKRKILWTYHVSMRLKERCISREQIISAIDSMEIIEDYPDDKYLPSCLILGKFNNTFFHLHVALDRENDNIRIITTYIPSLEKWNDNFKTRRES